MVSSPPFFSPQDVIKKLEKAVNELIEESAEANAVGDLQKVELSQQTAD